MPLKNWCSIHARCSKSSLKHSIHFCGIFPSLKQNFLVYRSSKMSDCIFEIRQLSQSGFSRVYSNCCCSCSFEADIIRIGQSSHKMYSNNILNFSRVYDNFKCLYKNSLETYWIHHVYTQIYQWRFKHFLTLVWRHVCVCAYGAIRLKVNSYFIYIKRGNQKYTHSLTCI